MKRTVKIDDATWLEPIANYYKAGGFDDKDIPVRVMNAIDSVNWYFGEFPVRKQK